MLSSVYLPLAHVVQLLAFYISNAITSATKVGGEELVALGELPCNEFCLYMTSRRLDLDQRVLQPVAKAEAERISSRVPRAQRTLEVKGDAGIVIRRVEVQ